VGVALALVFALVFATGGVTVVGVLFAALAVGVAAGALEAISGSARRARSASSVHC
jgi:hypothetical protein